MSERRQGYSAWIAQPVRAYTRRFDFGLRKLLSGAESPLWEVGWVEATGELYAKDPVSDRFIILGEFDSRYEVEGAMASLRADWTLGLLEWFGLTGDEEG